MSLSNANLAALQIISKINMDVLHRKVQQSKNALLDTTTVILFKFLSHVTEDDEYIEELLPSGFSISSALDDPTTMQTLKKLLFTHHQGNELYTRRHLVNGMPTKYRQLVLKIPPAEDELPPLIPFNQSGQYHDFIYSPEAY
jgi:hypothetical protein